MTEPSVDQLAARPPGSSRESPYADTNESALPDWWQAAVEEFRDHGMRPYRPPRLADGTRKHRVVSRLETDHDVRIRFIGIDVRYGDDWELWVDGQQVATVGRHRSTAGYTVFEVEPAELEQIVAEAVE